MQSKKNEFRSTVGLQPSAETHFYVTSITNNLYTILVWDVSPFPSCRWSQSYCITDTGLTSPYTVPNYANRIASQLLDWLFRKVLGLSRIWTASIRYPNAFGDGRLIHWTTESWFPRNLRLFTLFLRKCICSFHHIQISPNGREREKKNQTLFYTKKQNIINRI